MTTSDATPPYIPTTNSPNGQTGSDRSERRRARRARNSNEASSDGSDEMSGDSQAQPDGGGGTLARASELLDAVVARIRRQPYAAVAVASGVGFVVGGALSFRAGRMVLAAATRHVGRELFNQVRE